MRVILSLKDRAAQDSSVTGGKASALARLMAAGFPVPDGVVIIESGQIENELKAHLPAGRLAVRSSGFSEDSQSASFAGQYETVLGVQGLTETRAAIERCFASFSNDRSEAYRSTRGDGPSGGAVIVQRLIDAEAAGVAFTVDPMSGATDRVIIESNFGLGESVVGGHVTPDGFVVRKDSNEIIERRIANKKLRSVLDTNGTRLEDVPPELSTVPSLSDDAIREIAILASCVEQLYGLPVDIEWAWQGNRAHLLQARPVTAAGGVRPSTPGYSH
jgi:phosphoenolpyruvate synthase/pyruvate phosphate dikinase